MSAIPLAGRLLAPALALLVLAGCGPDGSAASACDAVSAIEGTYACSGVCADAAGTLQGPFSETDTIRPLGDSLGALYTVRIEGGGGFRETEIGALAGATLRTATAAVSDSTFPVVEEYVFTTDAACGATGFRKVVRGLNEGAFKACAVDCRLASAEGA